MWGSDTFNYMFYRAAWGEAATQSGAPSAAGHAVSRSLLALALRGFLARN